MLVPQLGGVSDPGDQDEIEARYDIAYAVNRISQTLGEPTRGTVRAIEHVAGYLRASAEFRLQGWANPGTNELVCMCDSSHGGSAWFR